MKRFFNRILGKEEPIPVPQGETFTRGKKNRIAVYIDIDDATPEDIPFVLDAMQAEGHVFIKRYFASHQIDTTDDKWFQTLHTTGVKPSEITGESNFESRSADIALSIDAIHTMISADIDIFVLVTSDPSFSPLVKTLKKYGKTVFLFGASSASDYLKSTCDQFFEGDNPSPKAEVEQSKYGYQPSATSSAYISPAIASVTLPPSTPDSPLVENLIPPAIILETSDQTQNLEVPDRLGEVELDSTIDTHIAEQDTTDTLEQVQEEQLAESLDENEETEDTTQLTASPPLPSPLMCETITPTPLELEPLTEETKKEPKEKPQIPPKKSSSKKKKSDSQMELF